MTGWTFAAVWNWLSPYVVPPAIIVAIVAIFRDYIATYLTKRVQARFDKQLEAIRSDFRVVEDRLKAELTRSEARVSTVTDTALSLHLRLSGELERRRLDAVERLWREMLSLDKPSSALVTLSMLKIENVGESIEGNDSLKSVMKSLFTSSDPSQLGNHEIESVRLYLSPVTWALFDAYRSVIAGSLMAAYILKLGMDPRKFMHIDGVVEAMSKIYPGLSTEKYSGNGFSAVYPLMKPLREKILVAIVAELALQTQSKQDVEKAIEISTLAENMTNEIVKARTESGVREQV